jgi:hypothetical protein
VHYAQVLRTGSGAYPLPPDRARGIGSRSFCASSIWDRNPRLGPALCSDSYLEMRGVCLAARLRAHVLAHVVSEIGFAVVISQAPRTQCSALRRSVSAKCEQSRQSKSIGFRLIMHQCSINAPNRRGEDETDFRDPTHGYAATREAAMAAFAKSWRR